MINTFGSGRPTFTLGDTDYELIRFVSPDKILVWADGKHDGSFRNYFCKPLSVNDFNEETLKLIGIWDKIPEGIKSSIGLVDLDKAKFTSELMAKARAGRRKRYVGVPSELTCIQCGKVQKIQPATLVTRVEKMAKVKGLTFTVEEFIKDFHCQICRPSKGRKSTGKCIPIELVCKCGKKVSYPINLLQNMAEKKGKTVEEFKSSYACQICVPTKFGNRKTKSKKGTE